MKIKKGQKKMLKMKSHTRIVVVLVFVLLLAGCCSGPQNERCISPGNWIYFTESGKCWRIGINKNEDSFVIQQRASEEGKLHWDTITSQYE
jgi:hypothetical protein